MCCFCPVGASSPLTDSYFRGKLIYANFVSCFLIRFPALCRPVLYRRACCDRLALYMPLPLCVLSFIFTGLNPDTPYFLREVELVHVQNSLARVLLQA
jgi:hypothetical protein